MVRSGNALRTTPTKAFTPSAPGGIPGGRVPWSTISGASTSSMTSVRPWPKASSGIRAASALFASDMRPPLSYGRYCGSLRLSVKQDLRAMEALVKGDPEPKKKLHSRGDDALANPFGPPVRAWNQVAETLERAAAACVHLGEVDPARVRR